ncbi:MAG: hypothetical protein KJI72_02805 [Patescibacteria group bacterium]|nr:hypothetical protein [Patescibacteria group bacterium]
MNGELKPTAGSKTPLIIVIVVVILVIAAVIYWYLVLRGPATPPVVETPTAEITSPDLGSELFERSSNPVSGQLPDTIAPVPNPLEGIYENPFGG